MFFKRRRFVSRLPRRKSVFRGRRFAPYSTHSRFGRVSRFKGARHGMRFSGEWRELLLSEAFAAHQASEDGNSDFEEDSKELEASGRKGVRWFEGPLHLGLAHLLRLRRSLLSERDKLIASASPPISTKKPPKTPKGGSSLPPVTPSQTRRS